MIVSRKLLVSAFVRAVPLRETGAGWLVRSAQCVHFSIFGASLSHSAVGTPHGHARTQYRQPMHLSASYVVGPSGCRSSAVVGQADSHAGSRQWKHRRIVKTQARSSGAPSISSSWAVMSVSVLALSVAGFWKPSCPCSSVSSPSFSFHCLHATWQARQPMHFVTSMRVVLMAGRTAGVLMLSSPWPPGLHL